MAGFGKKEITYEQFDKYILKKVDKKAMNIWTNKWINMIIWFNWLINNLSDVLIYIENNFQIY